MPCTLVRLAGCPLRCHYCDTPQAIPTNSGKPMAIDDIVQQVSDNNRPLVLITGGEPLAQRHCIELLNQLSGLDCIVQLETAGCYSVAHVPAGVRRVIDFKTPASGEDERNCYENIKRLRPEDEIKLVLASRADYEWARDFIRQHASALAGIPVLLSPVWGQTAARELCAWLLEDRLAARMQMQMHKVIWGPEAEGV
ncbi:MAG: radical SAM protein [Mariprofundus sp.]